MSLLELNNSRNNGGGAAESDAAIMDNISRGNETNDDDELT